MGTLDGFPYTVQELEKTICMCRLVVSQVYTLSSLRRIVHELGALSRCSPSMGAFGNPIHCPYAARQNLQIPQHMFLEEQYCVNFVCVFSVPQIGRKSFCSMCKG